MIKFTKNFKCYRNKTFKTDLIQCTQLKGIENVVKFCMENWRRIEGISIIHFSLSKRMLLMGFYQLKEFTQSMMLSDYLFVQATGTLIVTSSSPPYLSQRNTRLLLPGEAWVCLSTHLQGGRRLPGIQQEPNVAQVWVDWPTSSPPCDTVRSDFWILCEW